MGGSFVSRELESHYSSSQVDTNILGQMQIALRYTKCKSIKTMCFRMLHVTKILLGRHNSHLFTPDREPTTDLSTDTTKVLFGEAMSYIEVSGYG